MFGIRSVVIFIFFCFAVDLQCVIFFVCVCCFLSLFIGLAGDGRKIFDKDWDIAAGYVMSPRISADVDNSNMLIKMLQSGDLCTVGTDNCTFTKEQKYKCGKEDFRKIPNGCNGIENRLSIVWNECVMSGKLSESQFVNITSTNIAKIFNLYLNSNLW